MDNTFIKVIYHRYSYQKGRKTLKNTDDETKYEAYTESSWRDNRARLLCCQPNYREAKERHRGRSYCHSRMQCSDFEI
jgi:hypothetical protein